MIIAQNGGGNYFVRVVTPCGVADEPKSRGNRLGYPNRLSAERAASKLTYYLSPGGPDEDFGPPSSVEGILRTLRRMKVAPTDCAVEVVELAVEGSGPDVANGYRHLSLCRVPTPSPLAGGRAVPA